MTEYPTTADALFFDQQLIERYGGARGVRDVGALESALHRPQTGYYDTLIHGRRRSSRALFRAIRSSMGTSGSRLP
jgi:hypothetical protein